MDTLEKPLLEGHLTGEPCPSCGAEISLLASGSQLRAECDCVEALVAI